MSDLVTGEAVVLGVDPAKLPSRMLAKCVDLAILVVVYVGMLLALALALSGLDDAAVAAVALSTLVLTFVGLPVLVETLSHGRSPGKALMGLRVVRSDGGPIRFRHALVRGLLGFFELTVLSGLPAMVVSLCSVQGRRLGDIFAGTLVVRERTAGVRGAVPLPLSLPAQGGALGARLADADLSAVPEALWLAVRQYLGRAGQLYPEIAFGMAVRLAEELGARLGQAPPDQVHPAVFLAAALAERQRREWQRAGAGGYGRPAPTGPVAPTGVRADGPGRPLVPGDTGQAPDPVPPRPVPAAVPPASGAAGAAALPQEPSMPAAATGPESGFAPPA